MFILVVRLYNLARLSSICYNYVLVKAMNLMGETNFKLNFTFHVSLPQTLLLFLIWTASKCDISTMTTMINQTGDMNRKRKHRTIEMQEIVNLYFLETANIIPFQMAVRVQICSALWGYGCYNRLQWIRFIFNVFFHRIF